MVQQRKITLPDITRVKRRNGIVHEDLTIGSYFKRFHKKFRPKWYERKIELVENLFLGYYKTEDAIYRCDFLEEWLENKESRISLDNLHSSLPEMGARYVTSENNYGEPVSDESIKKQIKLIKKYFSLPETLEDMAELPGSSQASNDLRKFGIRARKSLNEYVKFIKPFKKSPQFKDKSTLDYEWANNCLDKIMPFVTSLENIRSIRSQLHHYWFLCKPYEFEIEGKRIPSCKPKFLDPDERRGKIINVYNPFYFKFGEKNKNFPNDISWGENARNNYIQGPNSMGKTVYLNTIGLNVHLPMAGLYCFADSCELSLPNRLFACFDLGDTLEAGHFETGGMKVNHMLNNIGIKDIVLLDEVGGGTEPEAERIIAKGITDGLLANDITFFCVTHDKRTWMEHQENSKVRNLRVADLNDKKNKYKVWEGIAKGGYAMQKAKEMGIDPDSVKKRLEQRIG